MGLFTGPVGADKEQLDIEELIAGRVIIGSPDECAEQLSALKAGTDFTRLVARVQWLGMDQDIVLRTIKLLGEEVAPERGLMMREACQYVSSVTF